LKYINIPEGKLAYTDRGKGETVLLLLHNAGGSHEMMSNTQDYFASSARVIAVDLLGHGSSAHPKIEYTVELLARAIVAMCNQLGLKQVVCIGLNYGANVGIEAAKLDSELISRLILIEPPLFMESWIIQLVNEQIKILERADISNTEKTVKEVLRLPCEKNQQLAIRAFNSTPDFVKISVYKHLICSDKHHDFHLTVPSLLIQASKPFCFEEKLHPHFSSLEVARVVGSGPWTNLEVPDQTHAMIERFLQLS
jgi:pimeloyl-ACP methyl ester carboxylesterase